MATTIRKPTMGVMGEHVMRRGIAVIPAANAVTTVGLAAYLLCAAVAIVAPDLLVGFFQPWLHGLRLDPLRPAGAWFQFGDFVAGLITLGLSAWLFTAAVAWLYNRWSGSERR